MNWHALLGVIGLALAATACGSDGTGTEPLTGNHGNLTMTLVRTAQSSVPAGADSALVRVWNDGTGVNLVKQVAIPDPGTSTSVSFSLPVGSGYSVGVLAYKSPREALAGGVTHDVTVHADATAEVSVSVVPWTASVSLPDTLVSGAETTITATITQGPVADFLVMGFLYIGLDKWNTYPSSGAKSGTLSGNVFSVTFNAPTVDSDTTVWYQFMFMMNGDDWNTPGSDSKLIYLPVFALGDTLFSRPIRPASGSLVVIFDETANSH